MNDVISNSCQKEKFRIAEWWYYWRGSHVHQKMQKNEKASMKIEQAWILQKGIGIYSYNKITLDSWNIKQV